MNKSHRDVFSRFYRLPVLDWRILVARLGGKKYRSAARMIFFRPTGPEDRLAPKGRNPIPLPCKNGKTSSLPSEPELFPVCQEIKKRMRTFRSASFLCVYSPVWGHSSGLQVRKISSVTSPVRSATSLRKTSGVSSPLSMRASRASQPEVSAAFAIPIPLTVS